LNFSKGLFRRKSTSLKRVYFNRQFQGPGYPFFCRSGTNPAKGFLVNLSVSWLQLYVTTKIEADQTVFPLYFQMTSGYVGYLKMAL